MRARWLSGGRIHCNEQANPRGCYGKESEKGKEGAKEEVVKTAPPKAGPDHLRCAPCVALRGSGGGGKGSTTPKWDSHCERSSSDLKSRLWNYQF